MERPNPFKPKVSASLSYSPFDNINIFHTTVMLLVCLQQVGELGAISCKGLGYLVILVGLFFVV